MKSIKNILSNKILVAILCFVIAAVIAFILVPVSNNHKVEAKNVLKVTRTITENTRITEDMIRVESISGEYVPNEALTDKKDVVGKYAKVNIYSSDFITPEKLSDIETESNLYSLNAGERAVSITPKILSQSVSGNLLIGDAVQLYGYDAEEKKLNEDSGKWYFEVLAIDNSKSENVSGVDVDDSSDIVPASITIKAISEEQVRSIVGMENNNDIQVVFAGRGETANTLLGKSNE